MYRAWKTICSLHKKDRKLSYNRQHSEVVDGPCQGNIFLTVSYFCQLRHARWINNPLYGNLRDCFKISAHAYKYMRTSTFLITPSWYLLVRDSSAVRRLLWTCCSRVTSRELCIRKTADFPSNSGSAHFHVSRLFDFIFYQKPLYKSLHLSFFCSFITILPLCMENTM